MKKNKYIVAIIYLIFFLSSCTDSGPRNRYIYIIENSTNFDVEILTFTAADGQENFSFTVPKGDVYKENELMSEPGDVLSTNQFLQGDSARIIFNDGKVLVYKCLQNGDGCHEDHNIFNSFETVTSTNNDERVFTNTYTITDEDYGKAE